MFLGHVKSEVGTWKSLTILKSAKKTNMKPLKATHSCANLEKPVVEESNRRKIVGTVKLSKLK